LGQIVAAFGRQYLVKLADGTVITCLTRGKKSDAVCGDQVEFKYTTTSTDNRIQGVIERIMPRHSLLHRSDAFREKLIASNVSQIVIVVAASPSFSDELLTRCLIAAFDQQLDVLIVLNKCDLSETLIEASRKRLAPYLAIGYEVIELSAKNQGKEDSPLPSGKKINGADALRPYLINHASVLVGQSGMGKSTLINALLPDAQAATREISTALDSGKHTTTHARLYRLNKSSSLIDCPGVQAFGLHHLTLGRIEQSFIEFSQYLGQCRFNDCHHLREPGCALQHAASIGEIDVRRLELFRQISQSMF